MSTGEGEVRSSHRPSLDTACTAQAAPPRSSVVAFVKAALLARRTTWYTPVSVIVKGGDAAELFGSADADHIAWTMAREAAGAAATAFGTPHASLPPDSPSKHGAVPSRAAFASTVLPSLEERTRPEAPIRIASSNSGQRVGVTEMDRVCKQWWVDAPTPPRLTV